jgi:hypothetical protein
MKKHFFAIFVVLTLGVCVLFWFSMKDAIKYRRVCEQKRDRLSTLAPESPEAKALAAELEGCAKPKL